MNEMIDPPEIRSLESLDKEELLERLKECIEENERLWSEINKPASRMEAEIKDLRDALKKTL